MDSEKYELFFRLVRKYYGHGGMRVVFNEFVDEFLSRYTKEERLKQEYLPIESFAPQTAPPRIIEDFTHYIVPYLNKSNPEELRYLSENAAKTLNYIEYCFLADRLGIMPHEERVNYNLTYERAETELKHLKGKIGVHKKW